MALLAVNCFANLPLLQPIQLSVEAARTSYAYPVRCRPIGSGLRLSRNLHRRLAPLPPAIAFVVPAGRRRRGVVSMAMNDNQGSSGEDMLHADEDFREATVIDAGQLYYQSSVPTIFLKMEASDLILPIVVNPQASQMLLQALRKEAGSRPTMYEVIREMCKATDMEVKMVRVTGRVVDTYHARIYLAQANSNKLVSVDAKPSDAINVAVASDAKIYIKKDLMESDGVLPEYKKVWTPGLGNGLRLTRPLPDAALDFAHTTQLDPLAEEMDLIKNMSAAAREERYSDAAKWRDELHKFRVKKEQNKQSEPNEQRRLHRQV